MKTTEKLRACIQPNVYYEHMGDIFCNNFLNRPLNANPSHKPSKIACDCAAIEILLEYNDRMFATFMRVYDEDDEFVTLAATYCLILSLSRVVNILHLIPDENHC